MKQDTKIMLVLVVVILLFTMVSGAHKYNSPNPANDYQSLYDWGAKQKNNRKQD